MTGSPTPRMIRVGLEGRAYDVVIGSGLLSQAGVHLGPLLSRPSCVIIADENTDAAHGERLRHGLRQGGIDCRTIVLAPGEQSKSFAALERLLSMLIDNGVERDDMIIALGGGVIGDLTGLASALLRRGCRYTQIPTSLLAQVDSSVGGKTAINMPQGKNLVGAFHQPALVLADIDTLATLPHRHLIAGLAEVMKYGAIGDAGFFSWLEANLDAVLGGDRPAWSIAVERSVAMKAEIVARDERERGDRALLNFGHTFGHALESATGFSDRLLHGEAVAAGMGMAFDYAVRLGLCPAPAAGRFKAALRRAGLPDGPAGIVGAAGVSAEAFVALMMQDKKVAQGALNLVLARDIGAAFVFKGASVDDLTAYLRSAGLA